MSSKQNSNESTETEAVRTRTAESPDGNSAHAEIRVALTKSISSGADNRAVRLSIISSIFQDNASAPS
jgi:hypothetical protein